MSMDSPRIRNYVETIIRPVVTVMLVQEAVKRPKSKAPLTGAQSFHEGAQRTFPHNMRDVHVKSS
jgi:hypothetical protein